MTEPLRLLPGRGAPCALVLLLVLLLPACMDSAESKTADLLSPSPSPTAAPSPSPPPSPSPSVPPPSPSPARTPPAVHPLTGAGPVPTSAVVAVKIDNSPLARPYHRGLGEAALVYQEVVEGGATRFLAVYAPAVGTEVGPIRSMREADIELLPQFGRIVLGASGANRDVLAAFRKAEADGVLLDANYEADRAPYRLAERRQDARNFFAAPAALDSAKPGGTWPKDVALRFGPLPAGAGTPAPRASVRFSQISDVMVQYDPASGRYAVFNEGQRLNGAAPANVVVQYVNVRETAHTDVLGNRTPYTETVGNGGVVLLRDGVQLAGGWSRGSRAEGTRLFDASMAALPLKPGPTWFLLVPNGRPLVVG